MIVAEESFLHTVVPPESNRDFALETFFIPSWKSAMAISIE